VVRGERRRSSGRLARRRPRRRRGGVGRRSSRDAPGADAGEGGAHPGADGHPAPLGRRSRRLTPSGTKPPVVSRLRASPFARPVPRAQGLTPASGPTGTGDPGRSECRASNVSGRSFPGYGNHGTPSPVFGAGESRRAAPKYLRSATRGIRRGWCSLREAGTGPAEGAEGCGGSLALDWSFVGRARRGRRQGASTLCLPSAILAGCGQPYGVRARWSGPAWFLKPAAPSTEPPPSMVAWLRAGWVGPSRPPVPSGAVSDA
jgi:hypothetical protein